MALLSPGLALLIFGLAESSGYGFGATRAWLPAVAGALLIASFFVHSWRAKAPLIDIRTFTSTRAGLSAVTFLLFTTAFFGSLLLAPLYYQSVRGVSALHAGLLLVPQGLGAVIVMPISGKLTDRYGPKYFPAAGMPLILIGMLPFAFVTAHTSYVLLCGFSVLQGIGMGLSMMPTMTAAMQAVPPQAIPRTSTAMNIIRQAGASVGTAILTVLLSSAIVRHLRPIVHGAVSGGFASLSHLPPSRHAAIAGPLASAFSSVFVWALVLLGLASIPALMMAFGRDRRAHRVGDAVTERPLVLE
jgi:MFS family permease